MKTATWGPYGLSILVHLCFLGFSWPVTKSVPPEIMPIEAELFVQKAPSSPEVIKPSSSFSSPVLRSPKKRGHQKSKFVFKPKKRAKQKTRARPKTASRPAAKGPWSVKQKIQDAGYKTRLRQIIKAKWKAPQMQRDYQLAFYCAIRADGRVSSLVLKESSGFDLLDQAAKRAILTSAPFPAPPKDLLNPSFEYEAWFRFHPEEAP